MRLSALIPAAFVLSVATLAGAAAQQPAPPAPAAPAPGPRTIVTYVEVQPSAEAQAIPLLKAYRDATRKDAGNVSAQVWQRVGPRGHFAVIEEWKDEESWKAHRGAAHVGHLHEKLTPLRTTAYDERNHTQFEIASSSMPPADAVLVVTHIDITPPGLPKALEILKAEPGQTRKDTGNVRFDVLRGMRQNHFTVLEGWRDERAREAHVAAAHTKAYREGLREQAVDGAPYDERLYRLVP